MSGALSYNPSPYDLIGVVTSVVSILALICSLIQANLPSVKLKELDEMLNAVDEQLKAAAEDGLLVEAEFVRQTSEALTTLRDDADSLRPSVHLAIRPFQQFIGLVTGLSWQISARCTNVMAIRAELTMKITEARQKMKRSRCQSERAPRLDPGPPASTGPESDQASCTKGEHVLRSTSPSHLLA